MINNRDLISVIVPIYNVEKYLSKCIDSILLQTYSNLEVLLIDDGSLDSCGKICDDYLKIDHRIVVIHKENGGLSDARNTGIKNAKGKYLTFVDSDDYIEKDYVEYLYSLICEYKTDLSIAAFYLVRNQKQIDTGKGYSSECLSTKSCLDRMLCSKGFNISACGKMYHKKLFKNVFFPYKKLCEDNATTYKLIMQCEFVAYGNAPKYNYVIRNNSIMTGKFNEKRFDLLEMVDLMCQDILNEYPDLKESVDKKIIESRFSILRQLLFSDDSSYLKEEQEIIHYLKENKNLILKNKKMGKREKIAIISLLFGKKTFQFVWKIYSRLR